jgi:hypothetical protein
MAFIIQCLFNTQYCWLIITDITPKYVVPWSYMKSWWRRYENIFRFGPWKSIDWGYKRTGCWREYMDLRERKWREAAEDCIIEELHKSYASPSIVRLIKWKTIRWARHVAGLGETRNAHKILVEKPEGKRPLRSFWLRWYNNIKMDP